MVDFGFLNRQNFKFFKFQFSTFPQNFALVNFELFKIFEAVKLSKEQLKLDPLIVPEEAKKSDNLENLKDGGRVFGVRNIQWIQIAHQGGIGLSFVGPV